jgi:hypothetical protein
MGQIFTIINKLSKLKLASIIFLKILMPKRKSQQNKKGKKEYSKEQGR